eukprot:TRINITY_DN19148_c0_g1_i2.p1 TRINITY_DN19148_c0_g1~~TRINITY_DN19148_c0_g1_i2.p1  ORF type:complete len:322 (-),score=77.45 TRINITY_DN19148_c0_g1_i2:229-1194(-)
MCIRDRVFSPSAPQLTGLSTTVEPSATLEPVQASMIPARTSASRSVVWPACAVCTFINQLSAQSCAMCNTPAPASTPLMPLAEVAVSIAPPPLQAPAVRQALDLTATDTLCARLSSEARVSTGSRSSIGSVGRGEKDEDIRRLTTQLVAELEDLTKRKQLAVAREDYQEAAELKSKVLELQAEKLARDAAKAEKEDLAAELQGLVRAKEVAVSEEEFYKAAELKTEIDALTAKIRQLEDRRLSSITEHRDSTSSSDIWDSDEIDEELACVVCMESPKTHIFIPCFHKCVCSDCASMIQRAPDAQGCPMCRKPFESVTRVFE